MTFKCLHSDKIISIDEINDGVCNCCDGSDEIFNNTFYCKNTCSVKFSENDIKVLKDYYQKGILNRIALSQSGSKQYADLKKSTLTATENMKSLYAKANNLTNNAAKLEKDVRKWVYEMNGLKEPTKEELLSEMNEYINKESHVEYFKAEDEEEGEDCFESATIDEDEFDEKKQRREEKWRYMNKLKYDNLFNNALEKFRTSAKKSDIKQNDFLSKLFNNVKAVNPPVYQSLLDVKKELNETRSEIEVLKDKVFNNNYRLSFDYGEDHQWFDAYGYTFEGRISNSLNRVMLTMMNRASVRLPSKGCKKLINFGAYVGLLDGLIVFKDDVHSSFTGDNEMYAKVACFPEKRVFSAYENTKNHVEVFLGAPEVCPKIFDETEFNAWLREIQFNAESILNERIYDSL